MIYSCSFLVILWSIYTNIKNAVYRACVMWQLSEAPDFGGEGWLEMAGLLLRRTYQHLPI